MRNLPRLLERAALSPVMILPAAHHSIMQTLMGQILGGARAPLAALDPQQPSRASQDLSEPQIIGRTAVIPLSGIFMKHASAMDVDCFGACSIETVATYLQMADEDPGISRIVLWVDSPGGEVIGTPELAAVVRSISEGDRTEMISFTDSLMCSAGYYVGSQAEMVLATPSAMVGSINAYIYMIDYSEYFKKEGLKAELFTEGKFKALGAPGVPLSDEQRQLMQERVVGIVQEFHGAVQDARDGAVAPEALEGQTFSGQQALDVNVIDAVVSGIDEAISFGGH